ncbi:unnamed protein product [Owenia fusiformis]|uniref:Uncharacterized protein n=1 Tax=Owenia fusiformis TaxID=6347 RepID=A0A8J1TWQ4_OWEFU|nr:unnamed protein product [Owenia fusiformis]
MADCGNNMHNLALLTGLIMSVIAHSVNPISVANEHALGKRKHSEVDAKDMNMVDESKKNTLHLITRTVSNSVIVTSTPKYREIVNLVKPSTSTIALPKAYGPLGIDNKAYRYKPALIQRNDDRTTKEQYSEHGPDNTDSYEIDDTDEDDTAEEEEITTKTAQIPQQSTRKDRTKEKMTRVYDTIPFAQVHSSTTKPIDNRVNINGQSLDRPSDNEDGVQTSVDKDGCDRKLNICPPDMECINTHGSYKCINRRITPPPRFAHHNEKTDGAPVAHRILSGHELMIGILIWLIALTLLVIALLTCMIAVRYNYANSKEMYKYHKFVYDKNAPIHIERDRYCSTPDYTMLGKSRRPSVYRKPHHKRSSKDFHSPDTETSKLSRSHHRTPSYSESRSPKNSQLQVYSPTSLPKISIQPDGVFTTPQTPNRLSVDRPTPYMSKWMSHCEPSTSLIEPGRNDEPVDLY